MKTSTKIIQFFIGVIPISLFLILAALSQDDIFLLNVFENFEYVTWMSITTVIMFLGMFLWVYLWAILCKWFKSDFIYYGALTGLIVPAVSAFISGFFLDDGNILSWIYMFTIGAILYPIGRLNYFAFNGINSFFNLSLQDSTISIIIIIIGVMSILLFRFFKKRRMIL